MLKKTNKKTKKNTLKLGGAKLKKKKLTTKSRLTNALGTIQKIEWDDHCSGNNGWHGNEDIRKEPIVCTSVGFLVHEDKKGVVLALNKDAFGKVSDEMYIVKSCIKTRKRLK